MGEVDVFVRFETSYSHMRGRSVRQSGIVSRRPRRTDMYGASEMVKYDIDGPVLHVVQNLRGRRAGCARGQLMSVIQRLDRRGAAECVMTTNPRARWAARLPPASNAKSTRPGGPLRKMLIGRVSRMALLAPLLAHAFAHRNLLAQTPAPSSLQPPERAAARAWFRDAKFGLF